MVQDSACTADISFLDSSEQAQESSIAGILDTVDQRTQLVGENRLEILTFRLAGRQLFAINVFKVQEVLQLPKLTLMPQRHPFVCGVVNLREIGRASCRERVCQYV